MPSNALHEALSRAESPATLAKISTVIAANPNSLLEKDDAGRNPLLFALRTFASMEVVQALIDACPAAILELDIKGRLPVHCMLRFRQYSYARALINANPACLQLSEIENGCLPLQLAVRRARGIDLTTFKLILEGFPEACKMRDGDGLVPLESALDEDIPSRVHFEIIEALVRAFPEALKIKDSTHGIFLMQIICARFSLTETFISLVQATCPEAFIIADHDGWVPLHYMMQYFKYSELEIDNEAQQTAVLSVVRACPEAASFATEDGQLPLHMSMGCLNVRGVRALVEVYPDAVVTKGGEFGGTPLHMLLGDSETFSLDVAKVLVAARPDALVVKDDEQGNIPLATAVQTNTDLPTVEWLFNAWPESVMSANNRGQIPLHIAVGEEFIRMLYQAWPEGAKRPDSRGMLPLATAVKFGSQETVAFLLEAYPDAVWAKDDEGLLPLHHAAIHSHGSRLQIAKLLLVAYPETARIKDKQGRLPVHHAVRYGSLHAVTPLIAAWPDSLKEADTFGDIPLFDAFERDEFDEGIAKLLLGAWPDSLKCTNSTGDLPIHMVSRLTNGANDMNLSDACARAKYLIDRWPEPLGERNRDGDLPLHILLSCMNDEEQVGFKRKRHDVVNGQLELVRLFVYSCPESIEMVDGEGSIPLIVASQNNKVTLDVVDFLTKASMNVLPTSRTGRFPASDV